MTFTDSIKTCFTKYADFNGRASRSEYWWFILFVLLVVLGLSIISHTLSSLFYLAVLIPLISVCTRRLHDTNRSGWFQVIGLVPIIGLVLLIFLVQEGKEPNRF